MSNKNDTLTGLNINNIVEQKSDSTRRNEKNEPHDEPGQFPMFGVICFSTATLLLGISHFNAFDNPMLLTLFGFFIGGLGQLIAGIMEYKEKYYIDGNVFFYFALNWGITTCYDIFPGLGLMEPLGHKEYGYHNLLGCFFTLIFCIQNFKSPSILNRISFTTTFLGFIFSTIGSFCDRKALMKISGVFNIITAVLAYYCAFANILNGRYNKVYFPTLDGKYFGDKLD